jgi:hypothetical protein
MTKKHGLLRRIAPRKDRHRHCGYNAKKAGLFFKETISI